MSKSLVSGLLPRDVRTAVAALPMVGMAAEVVGLAARGSTLRALRQVAMGASAAGLIVEASIAVATALHEEGDEGVVRGLAGLLTK
jgi:hypothetical protein